MQMRNIAVIINPVAGKGKTIELLPKLKSLFDEVKSIVTVHYSISSNVGEISSIAKSYWNKGISEFVSIGGDGTLSEIINGLDFDQIRVPKISVIPAGTGNDFIRTTNGKLNLEEIVQSIVDGKGRFIDLGVVNDFYFINTCSFGIDGPITSDTAKYKKVIPGRFSYFYSTIKNGLTFKSQKVKITIDQKTISEKMLMIIVGNGKYAGGGMKLCPKANLEDGLLDVCMVTNVSVLKFMKEITSVYSGKFIELKEVVYIKGRNIKIEVDGNPYLINADGNLIGSTPANIRIIEKALFIYM